MEANKASTEHDFWMQGFRNGLDQVGVSVERNIVQDPDSLVPSFVELIKLGSKEIIETGRVETAGINFVEIHDNIRIAEVKLLI